MGYYDEVEIEDFVWDPVARTFHYPCPCGGASEARCSPSPNRPADPPPPFSPRYNPSPDRFEITKLMLRDGEDIATCPSCSLIVRVIYDPVRVGPP